MILRSRIYRTARARWTGLGPYYAMFPAQFCDKVVTDFTEPGDVILDPFAGRGTAVFSAATLGRRALGIELNPVGWIYGKTKLAAAPQDDVLRRLHELSRASLSYPSKAAQLPTFFHHCFTSRVRQFLLASRRELDWEGSAVDRTLMSIILVNLHGKRDASLSNQMRQTKSMAPAYAVRWWKKRKLRPPDVDPIQFLEKRISWRYARGIPVCTGSEMLLGDSAQILDRPAGRQLSAWRNIKLLLTSPPYFGITNYYYDQWLRLWLLGGQPRDAVVCGKYCGKFVNRGSYEDLLRSVFQSSAALMDPHCTIYVRTDRRQPTCSITIAALKSAFPGHRMTRKFSPHKKTQTALFGYFAPKFGEVDLILRV